MIYETGIAAMAGIKTVAYTIDGWQPVTSTIIGTEPLRNL